MKNILSALVAVAAICIAAVATSSKADARHRTYYSCRFYHDCRPYYPYYWAAYLSCWPEWNGYAWVHVCY